MADTQAAPAGQPHDPPHAGPNAADDEESILRELNAAIAANPELRAATPRPAEGEWEDFDRLLAEHPELAAPVSSKPKEYYRSKDKWDCGHEGEEAQTDIERDPEDGTPALLINEVRGICDKCMEKWANLESASGPGDVQLGGSSRGPAGPPSYGQPQSALELEVEDDEEEMHSRGLIDVDEGSGKGKSRPGRDARYDADADDDDDDDDSVYSHEAPLDRPSHGPLPTRRGPPFPDDDDDDYDDDDEDEDGDLVPHPLNVRRSPEGHQEVRPPGSRPYQPPEFESDDEDDGFPSGDHRRPRQ
ncbi:hypothetical protein PRK78_003537 [Emydomyces testavorans]|uniref:Uncharacterized protein n=1 Tax=Emydomyces testavorans TaxID=2070801 RepID=A0AAF0DJD2_9EURO|nr:hypothetical protein PRK78_003537 [Emydomyces testavorans]